MEKRKIFSLVVILFILVSNVTIITAAFENEYADDSKNTIKYFRDGILYKGHQINSEDIENMKKSIGVREEDKNYNEIIDGHGTGLSPPDENYWNDLEGDFILDEAVSSNELTSSHDISSQPYFPEIRSQGGQGSCAAWAMTYYAYGYREAKDNDWTEASQGNNSQLISPAWTYNRVNGGSDDGSGMGSNGEVIKNTGVSTWAKMPYDDSDFTSWGDDYAFREAPLHRANNVKYISYSGDSTVDTVKNLLSSDVPVTFAMDANGYNFSDGNYIMSSTEYEGDTTNHAQTFVGYDDSITEDGENGAFKVANSWGQNWGDNGYYWITYDTFKEMGNTHGLYLTYIEDKIDYKPSLLGVWHFNNKPTRDSIIELGIGDINNPDDSKELYFYTDSSHNYPDFLSLDISEFEDEFDSGTNDFYLDIGSSSSNGVLSSFKIEHYENNYDPGLPDQVSSQSSGLPQNTPCQVTNTLSDHAPISINEGVDNQNLNFTTSGPAGWTGVNDEYYNDSDSIRSGDIGNGYSSEIETQVYDEGLLSFYWKISSSSYDKLKFYINNTLKSQINGTQSWTEVNITISSGVHTLIWEYEKDSTLTQNDDCGWLDNIKFLTDNLSPNEPKNPSPPDGEMGMNTSPELGVFVSDPNQDSLNVSFFNAENNTLLGTTSVQSGNRTNITWNSLSKGTVYKWYAVANDSEYQTRSQNWTFSTYDDMDPEINITSPLEGEMFSTTGVTIEWNGTDEGLGIDHYELKIDSSSWSNIGDKNKHVLSSLSEGDHTVHIKAVDKDGNTDIDNVSFYIDSLPPEILDRSPDDANGYNYTFNVSINDASNISSAYVFYEYEGGGPFNESMNLKDGDYYEKEIQLPSKPIKIYYNVSAEDILGNWNSTGEKSRVISDDISPEITDNTGSEPTTSDQFTILANVSDNFELETVEVTYWSDVSDKKTEIMQSIGGDDFQLDLNIPSSATILKYNISAEDTSGNIQETGVITLEVADNDEPILKGSHPENPTTGDIWNLDVIVTDNIDIESVKIHYHTDVTSEISKQLNKNDDEYGIEVSIPTNATTFTYNITAIDSAGNENFTGTKTLDVIDNDLPSFNDNSQVTATTGDNFTFNFTGEDNIQVERMILNYWTDVSSRESKMSINEKLKIDIKIPSSANILFYNFTVEDEEGNKNYTGKQSITVTDDDSPTIVDKTEGKPETGENYTVIVQVDDNIGIEKVYMNYSIDDRSILQKYMNKTELNNYSSTIMIPKDAETFSYAVHAVDTSENSKKIGFEEKIVLDVISPTAEIGNNMEILLSEELHLRGDLSSDNIGIVNYQWTVDGKEFTGKDISYNFTDIGNYEVILNVSDGYGNFDTDVITVVVEDKTPPVADAGENITAYIDHTIELRADETYDNHNITDYIWTISDEIYNGKNVNLTFENTGTYTAELKVIDESGNFAYDNVTINIENPPPGDIEIIDFSVDTESEYKPVNYTVNAVIENIGGQQIDWELVIDGSVVRSGSLQPDERKKLTFEGIFDEKGEHTINLHERTETVEVDEKTDDQPGFVLIPFLLVLILITIIKKKDYFE